MAKCGEYEIEKAIAWGRRSTFFSARANGDSGDSLLVIRRARIAERSFAQAFLRAAAEQQTAVGAGCRRIAPILGFHLDEAGFAFYATVRYETSLAEFLETGCQIDSSSLREIVTGVLGVLAELSDKSRRSHGNLTAGNILLDPAGKVFLTDLAPAAKDATVADDFFALGTVIYQLVRRTARVGTLNPPLEYSPEWTESLGDDAEGWREFANRLLNRPRNKGPEAIKGAIADLKSLGSLAATAPVAPVASGDTTTSIARKPPPKKSAPPKMIALLLVLAAAGGGGFMWWKQDQDAKERVRIVAEEEERRRVAAVALGPAINTLKETLKKPLPDDIAADKDTASVLERIRKTLGGIATKSDVQTALGNWELPDKLKARAKEWRDAPRAWERLAGELERAGVVDLDGETALLDQFGNAIRAWNTGEGLDQHWSDIAALLSDLSAAKNPLLPDFTQWSAEEIRAASRLPDAPARALGVIEKIRAVREFNQRDWARVRQERFTDALKSPSPEVMSEWPREWVRQAQRYMGPSDEKLAAWQKIIARTGPLISKRPAKEQPTWTAKLQTAKDQIVEALESDAPAIDKLIAELNTVRDPLDEEHEKYTTFLAAWKPQAAAVTTREEAQAALKKYRDATSGLLAAYRSKAGVQKLIDQLDSALKTPDNISLEFTKPGWELISSDTTAAIYRFGEIAIPFLALGKTGFAMAAVETPLSLAKLSNSGGSSPGDGPQIRSGTMDPSPDWLWRGPRDFIQGNGIASYFANGVVPGDTGNNTVPVTWLGFTQADAMAKELGGELPTPEHFSAASNLNQGGSGRRLRSGAWTRQLALVNSWRNLTTGHAGRLPDSGSFSKQVRLFGNNAYLSDASAAAGAADDGAVWLKSVFPNGSNWRAEDKLQFVHLIGNAAEWVNDNRKPAIMGGSVVSAPSLPTNAVLTPPANGVYFDVTFRLVVKLGAGGAGAGLAAFTKAAGEIPDPPAP